MNKKLYLAYGSNLNIDQMKYRCPDAEKIGSTILRGYELVFRGNMRRCGVANIEKKEGSFVPVGVWSISEADEVELDKYEGYPFLYDKEWLTVEIDGKEQRVMAYIMTGTPCYALPVRGYFNIILEGFEDFGLDKNVLFKAAMKTKNELFKKFKLRK